MDFYIMMGNKMKCNPVGRGTISFRDSHEPGLGMNQISISHLQGKGYDVHFISKKGVFQTLKLEEGEKEWS